MTDMIDSVKTREDFIAFMNRLIGDRKNNPSQWENQDLESYLEGILSWVEDMDGYYANTQQSIPDGVDWKFIAALFYIGRIYE